MRGRFVLGLGTDGKPAMAAAIGVGTGRTALWFASGRGSTTPLRGLVDPGLHVPLRAGYCAPPMWLASDDVAKRSAI